jgi:hypothetical protein
MTKPNNGYSTRMNEPWEFWGHEFSNNVAFSREEARPQMVGLLQRTVKKPDSIMPCTFPVPLEMPWHVREHRMGGY